MPESSARIAFIPLSESFRQAMDALAIEEKLVAVVVDPIQLVLPEDCVAVLILAGGAEAEAIECLGQMGRRGPRRYVVGAAEHHRLAAGAMAKGASDYFALPGDLDLLRRTLEREAAAWRAHRAAERFAAEERRESGFDAILGSSPALLQVIAQASRVADHRDVTVMIGGEPGTGKELFAQAIHYHSPRFADPFIEVNCTVIPANLIESELFGHEKGAFVGAVAARPSVFEMAQGGTVFLDEIGHLPLEAQLRLLRVLETRQVRRVAGREPIPIDVRTIASTHVDLRAAVAAGEFRADLYDRLHVVELTLPALRDRGDDIEYLAEGFAAGLATAYGLPVPAWTPAAREALRAHHWPGNVRELRNVVERAVVLSPPGTLELGDPAADAAWRAAASGGHLPLFAPLATVIRAAAEAMMAETAGNKSEAARRLTISRARLQRILDGIVD